VTTRPAAQRIAELLIRAACRRLPGDVREERRREWSAELLAILDDPGVRVAVLRGARALRYAAGICRSAGRLHRSALGASAAVTVPARWASWSRRRPLGRVEWMQAGMTAADDTLQRRAQQTSPLAIVSLVCGMVALVLGPLAIVAIVSGHIARGQIRRTGEGGRGMATAGLILGYVVLVVGIALVVAFVVSLPNF
jgi:uncharacterized protein DUF4190